MQNILQWLREFKSEAPWYFWAFASLTLLGMVYEHSIISKATWVALLLGAILLKKFDLLRVEWLYRYVLISLIFSSVYTYMLYDYAVDNGLLDLGRKTIINPQCYIIDILLSIAIMSIIILTQAKNFYSYLILLIVSFLLIISASLGVELLAWSALLLFAH